jgi:voltage-gated sodium channel
MSAATTATPSTLRLRVHDFVENRTVQTTVMWLIVLNALVLGLETSDSVMALAGGPLRALDQALLAVFVVEIALRLFAHRAAFFRDPWSVFDLLVVTIALLPATGPLAVLRALRVLRVLRLLTIVPSMRRVVGALLAAIPGLGSIAGVLAILFYVFGVIATKLFGETFPEWFGSLGASLYTLFQVMTLESWSMGIARPVMETHPHAWVFFVPFILVATFTMLNLFIAIIVNAMQSFNEDEQARLREAVEASREHVEADLHAEMRQLRAQIAELRTLLVARRAEAGVPPVEGGTDAAR